MPAKNFYLFRPTPVTYFVLMKKSRYSSGLLSAALILLSGCAVYVPTVPSTPLLRGKGEVELMAALRGVSSLEAGAAWSPVPQLLVTGEAALQTSTGGETRNNVTTNYSNVHRQGGLGLGTYRLLGADKQTYLAAIGGVGFASASVYDNHIDGFYLFIPLFGPLVHYEATYQRYYGQVYIAQQGPLWSYGLSARATFVNYSTLLRNDVSIEPPSRFFLEPTLFVRVGRRAFQGQATFGLSTPLSRGDRQNPDITNLAPISTLISVGVVIRPHFFQHRDEVPDTPYYKQGMN